MNRRQAIQQLSIMGVGLTLFPSCDTEQAPLLARIPFTRNRDYKIFREFSEAILPVDYQLYPAPEPRAQFILTILNDNTNDNELSAWKSGFGSFLEYLKERKISTMEKLSEDELNQLYVYLAGVKEKDENLFAFYRTTRSLARQHFMSCEKFMTEELKYEFVPGRYIGCAKVTA